MTDHIRLTRIGVFAYHGAHPEEQKLGQRFYISLDCAIDLAEAGRTDDLSSTVDYSVLVERVQEMAVMNIFKTIEALADAIATACLKGFPRLSAVTVTVEKPSAAIAAIFEGVSVQVTRARQNG